VNAALVRFKDGLRSRLRLGPPAGGLEIHRPDLSKSADRQIQNAPLAIRLSNFDPEQWWQTLSLKTREKAARSYFLEAIANAIKRLDHVELNVAC
jgi:hypothetical protein